MLDPAPEPAPSASPSPAEATGASWILAAGALAVLLAALSAWGVGWIQDDWRLLARARAGRWVLPEPNHLSLPLGLLWWLGDATGSPLPARLAALAAHLLSHGLLVPALARALLPQLAPRAARQAGLLGLCAWVALDPLVWACTAAYALLLPCLLGATLLHLRGLEGRARAGVGSLALLALGLLTWELAVAGPALFALAAWGRGRSGAAALRSALPACALLLLYAGLKLLAGSTETLAPRGPLRLALNLGATPLFLASPLPWPRAALQGPAGPLAAVVAGALLAGLLLRPRRREPLALAGMALAPLLPLLPGPGPESRYLYLGVPFAALAVRVALAQAPPLCGRRPLLLLLGAWTALSAASAWAWAARWRQADREARACLDQATAAALVRGTSRLALVDVPDRLPGWGPCWKHPVWRLGLEEALAGRGLELIGRAHTSPPDPETQGLLVETPPLDAATLAGWDAAGVLVLRAGPAGLEPATGAPLTSGASLPR